MQTGGSRSETTHETQPWRHRVRFVYEFSLLGAAVYSAYLIVQSGSFALAASWAIWAWFAIDYSVRLYLSPDRMEYIRGHRLELVAALPLDFFRPLRLLRVLRPLGILVRATAGLRDALGLNGFNLIGAVGVAVVLLGGALLTWVEPEAVPSLADGMWWSLVTATTVGYGDISPTTTGGRIVAGGLMVTGIGLLGALTGEVAERVTRQAAQDEEVVTGDAEVDHLIRRLSGWQDLSSMERKRLVDVLAVLAEQESPDSTTLATTSTRKTGTRTTAMINNEGID